MYFKAVKLKGKADDVRIYYPLDVSADQMRKFNKVCIEGIICIVEPISGAEDAP